MDPNETLRRLRQLIGGTENVVPWAEAVDLFTDLDEWLSKGGFLPQDWAGVQQLNTVESTSKGPCTATVRINTKTLPCELDAPHPGWAHTNIDSRRTVNWCSDAEAEAVVVE